MPKTLLPPAAFAPRLLALRKASGLTQVQLAAAAGLTSNYLARVERGQCEPSWPTVCRIADALGVGVERFRRA